MPSSTRIGLSMAVGLALSGLVIIALVLAGLPVGAGLVLLLVLDLGIIWAGYTFVRRYARTGR